MYGYVWGIDAPICMFMVSGNDPIVINENVRDYIKELKMCLNAIIYYNGNLGDENPTLKMSTTI